MHRRFCQLVRGLLVPRALCGCLVAAAGQASATWSILLVDLSTGEIAVGSATCLTGFDLQANTPVLIPGVGAATAQSFVDSNGFNRTLIRDRLHEGVPPALILDELAVFDGGHQTRQYGMVDVLGNAETFSGTGAGAWAGGTTGVLPGAGITGGDVLYAIQGNVLWGPAVVDDAVDAVRDAPGDLPAKLLAGMQAARDAGGDGRCSCLPNDADACIDDEPMGQKSSDIAYMLVARAGDREGCSPIHRLGGAPLDIEPLDNERFVVSFRNGNARLAFVRPGGIASPPVLDAVEFIEPAVDLDEIAVGDVTGDGLPDIIGCTPDNDGTWLLAADADEPTGFAEPAQLLETGHDPVIDDLDGDGSNDVVVVDSTNGEIVVLWNDAGALSPGETIAVGGRADEADVADIDGDGLLDIAVVCRDDVTARVVRQSAPRELFAESPMPLSVAFPSIIKLADVDVDGTMEVVVGGLSTNQLQWLDASTGVSEGLVPVPSNIRDISLVDAGDGPRVFVTGIGGSVLLEPFFPGGPVVFGLELPIFQQPVRTLPRDLDGDGDEDLAVVGLTGQAVRLIDNVAGTFPLTQGCGDGDFYMEFNVAFSRRDDPDPVDQLEGLFADWAGGLVGIPDAVRSTVAMGEPFVQSEDGCETAIRIELRDREGLLSSADSITVTASSGLLEVGSAAQVSPGVFKATVIGTGARGNETLLVEAVVGDRSVRLMPSLEVRVDDPADFDFDGDRDGEDLLLWLAAYQAGDAAADQNFDGAINPADFNAWVRNANRGCLR